jgi:hypothetical protein
MNLVRNLKAMEVKTTHQRLIFTANRHLYDDVFNFWTALAVESGSRLVVAQHGGNYGISEFPSFARERHENSRCRSLHHLGLEN